MTGTNTRVAWRAVYWIVRVVIGVFVFIGVLAVSLWRPGFDVGLIGRGTAGGAVAVMSNGDAVSLSSIRFGIEPYGFAIRGGDAPDRRRHESSAEELVQVSLGVGAYSRTMPVRPWAEHCVMWLDGDGAQGASADVLADVMLEATEFSGTHGRAIRMPGWLADLIWAAPPATSPGTRMQAVAAVVWVDVFAWVLDAWVWMLGAVAAAMTAWFGPTAVRVWRRRRRRARGACQGCGYDLDGQDGTCPECGVLTSWNV